MFTQINGFRKRHGHWILALCALVLMLGFSSYAFAAADETALDQIGSDVVTTIFDFIKDHVLKLVAIAIAFFTVARLLAGAYFSAAIGALAFVLVLFFPKMIQLLGG